MKTLVCVLRALSLLVLATPSAAWTTPIESTAVQRQSKASASANDDAAALSRRALLRKAAGPAAAALATATRRPGPASARSEEARKCDPGDARCRRGGELVGEAPSGRPVPAVTNRITYVVQMIVDVGERRENDAGYLRFGLYGDDCPGSARQMLLFLTRGIASMDRGAFEDALTVDYAPVSLADGGSVQNIDPGKCVDFGVPSQSKEYARSRGLRTAGPTFAPQSRPVPTLEAEAFPRPHSVAGLISVPAKGIGYGNNLPDDEAYSLAFAVTADGAPEWDKPNSSRRRVIGQVIDEESMRFLDRLANLPVRRGVGTGDAGPPLLKVRVRDIGVQKVKEDGNKKKKKP